MSKYSDNLSEMYANEYGCTCGRSLSGNSKSDNTTEQDNTPDCFNCSNGDHQWCAHKDCELGQQISKAASYI